MLRHLSVVTVSATETKTALLVNWIVDLLVAQEALPVPVAANVAPTSATQEEERANRRQIVSN